MSNQIRPPVNRRIGDTPSPGYCKLRITSDGTSEGTEIVVVDDIGQERVLLGAVAVSWKLGAAGELATACVRVDEADVELDAERVEVRPAGDTP